MTPLAEAAIGGIIDGAEVVEPGVSFVEPGTHNTHRCVGNKPSVSDAQAPGDRLSNGFDTDRGLVAMTERTQVSKGLRFTIFRRDGFTCQYCGAQPPDAVLHVDHIRPVVEGGDNDEMNLVTACQDCNLGKGRKLLDNPQRPDADMAWLEAQQELAELRRYQKIKAKRDKVTAAIIVGLRESWCKCSGLSWHPSDEVFTTLLRQYGPEAVEEACYIVAPKVSGGYIKPEYKWLAYLYATLRNIAVER